MCSIFMVMEELCSYKGNIVLVGMIYNPLGGILIKFFSAYSQCNWLLYCFPNRNVFTFNEFEYLWYVELMCGVAGRTLRRSDVCSGFTLIDLEV